MADEEVKKEKTGGNAGNKDIAKTLIIVGGTALIGWGGYMLISRLTDLDKAADERYMEIWREYQSEVEECDAFYAELVAKGSATELEQEHLDFMKAEIARKEAMADNLNHTYLYWLAEDLKELAKTGGLYYILPAVLVAGTIYAAHLLHKSKKWPVCRKQPPPPLNPGGPDIPPGSIPPNAPTPCPHCGIEFPTYEQFKSHILMYHPAATDAEAKYQAAQIYNSLNQTTRAAISAQLTQLNLTPPPAGVNWLAVTGYVLQGIAVAAMVYLSAGAATPALGGIYGGYSVVTEAEAIAASALARTAVLAAV
jgi:hypothetical protein